MQGKKKKKLFFTLPAFLLIYTNFYRLFIIFAFTVHIHIQMSNLTADTNFSHNVATYSAIVSC